MRPFMVPVICAMCFAFVAPESRAQQNLHPAAARALDEAKRDVFSHRKEYEEENKKTLNKLVRDLQRIRPPVDVQGITDDFRKNFIPTIDSTARPLRSPLPNPKEFTFNGNDYEIIEKQCLWTAAEAECRKAGGHLATIETRDEQKAVADALKIYFDANKQKLPNGATAWIGAQEVQGQQGAWQWLGGAPLGFTQWTAHHPNGVNPGRNYLSIDMSSGDWVNMWDRVNPSTLCYICEWDNNDDDNNNNNNR